MARRGLGGAAVHMTWFTVVGADAYIGPRADTPVRPYGGSVCNEEDRADRPGGRSLRRAEKRDA